MSLTYSEITVYLSVCLVNSELSFFLATQCAITAEDENKLFYVLGDAGLSVCLVNNEVSFFLSYSVL